jgi:hypothetical protein
VVTVVRVRALVKIQCKPRQAQAPPLGCVHLPAQAHPPVYYLQVRSFLSSLGLFAGPAAAAAATSAPEPRTSTPSPTPAPLASAATTTPATLSHLGCVRREVACLVLVCLMVMSHAPQLPCGTNPGPSMAAAPAITAVSPPSAASHAPTNPTEAHQPHSAPCTQLPSDSVPHFSVQRNPSPQTLCLRGHRQLHRVHQRERGRVRGVPPRSSAPRGPCRRAQGVEGACCIRRAPPLRLLAVCLSPECAPRLQFALIIAHLPGLATLAGSPHACMPGWPLPHKHVQVREVGDGNINYVYIVEGPQVSLAALMIIVHGSK